MSAQVAEREAIGREILPNSDTRELFVPLFKSKPSFLIAPEGSKKVSPLESLDMSFVRENMRGLIRMVYGSDLVLREYNGESLDNISGAIVNPLARWNEGASMWISLNDTPAQSIDSLSPIERKMVWALHADQVSIMQQLHPGLPIMIGACNSAGGIDGPMSVLAAHTQTLPFPEELRDITINDILAWKATQRGDGVSGMVGRSMTRAYQQSLPQKFNAMVGSDQLGAFIHLKGFTPQDLMDKAFQQFVATSLFHIPHAEIRNAHDEIYSESLDDVIESIQVQARKNGGMDKETHHTKFKLREITPDESYRAVLLRQLANTPQGSLLRETFGWSLGMVFIDDDALLTINPAFRKDMPSGGMENHGILLDRSSPKIASVDEMIKIEKEFGKLTAPLAYVSRLRYLNAQSYYHAA